MIILDTNVVSELMKPGPDPSVHAWVKKRMRTELFTTSISEAEIFYGIELLRPGKRRETLTVSAEAMFAQEFEGRILGFESGAARNFSRILAQRRAIGRPMSYADAQIAAIAQLFGATIATRNVADFRDCGVDLVDPWAAT
jgi:predicted nucleic acid-binding protein